MKMNVLLMAFKLMPRANMAGPLLYVMDGVPASRSCMGSSHSAAVPLRRRAGSRAPPRYVGGYFLEFFAVAFLLYHISVVAEFYASLTPLASLVTSMCWAASSSPVYASLRIEEGPFF